VRITADTNVLLRAILDDDPGQSPIAQAALSNAEIVAVSLPTLCELVWTMRRGYRRTQSDVIAVLRALVDTPNVVLDRPAVEAGIDLAEAGGDFADGVISFEGRRYGAAHFATFDRDAAQILSARGFLVLVLNSNREAEQ
jgi:predicted nucleic-acid-binding protein